MPIEPPTASPVETLEPTAAPSPTATPIAHTGDRLQIICDSAPFSPAVFDRVPTDEREDHPTADAFRAILADPLYAPGPIPGWWRVARDDTSVQYVGRLGGEVFAYVRLESGPHGWELANWGECTLQPALAGLSPATWELDPAARRPTRASTRIPVLVTEIACANGRPVDDRLLRPAIAYGPERIFVTFAAVPLPGEGHDCPGNPSARVLLRLREPLGDRELEPWVPAPEGSGG